MQAVGTGSVTGKPFVLERNIRGIVKTHYSKLYDIDGVCRVLYQSYDLNVPPRSVFLTPSVQTLTYVVLRGRRITPKSSSAIVKVRLPGFQRYLAGDVVRLLLHQQAGYAPQVFAEMAWMIPTWLAALDGPNDPWKDL